MVEWAATAINVKSVDWNGKPITIPNVPAEINTKTKKIRVNPDDVARAEFGKIAQDLGIHDRDILLFLLLYAKPGPFQRGYLCQKYKVNKMLFYQWKESEKEGLGDAIPRDEFEVEDRGPVPKNLWKDLKRLKEEGLVKVEGGRKEQKAVTIELTENGAEIAKKLWNRAPDPYLVTTTRVKDWLFPKDPETIKHIVHQDYPEYRRVYRVADKEELLKI